MEGVIAAEAAKLLAPSLPPHTGTFPSKPAYPALRSAGTAVVKQDETRSVRVPAHRFTPLKESWEAIVKPITDHMKLLIRMNPKARSVELKPSAFTTDPGALQKGEDFIKAFILGFDVNDALALLRLDDLYVESFEVTDVKPLKGDHLSRAIGRLAGASGKTRIAIENATRVRIVVADAKIHILGAFANIAVARDACCALIMGSPPGAWAASPPCVHTHADTPLSPPAQARCTTTCAP
jgi:RNA-binding protein PNO1